MVSKRKKLSLKERIEFYKFAKECNELAKESQASDNLKCKAEILEEFESNILDVLNGFQSALQRYQCILILFK